MNEDIYILIISAMVVLNVISSILHRKSRGMDRKIGYMNGYNNALRDMAERVGSCGKCEYYSDGMCAKNDIDPEKTWFCADYKELKEERNNEK
jgi:hypothetical protein